MINFSQNGLKVLRKSFFQEMFEDCSHALVLSTLPPLTHLPYPAPLAKQLCLALSQVVHI